MQVIARVREIAELHLLGRRDGLVRLYCDKCVRAPMVDKRGMLVVPNSSCQSMLVRLERVSVTPLMPTQLAGDLGMEFRMVL